MSVPNNDYLRNWRMRSGKSGRPGSSTDSHLPLQHRHALLSSTPAGWCQWWWWWRLWSWLQWWWWWLVSRFIYRFDYLVHFLLYILNAQHALGSLYVTFHHWAFSKGSCKVTLVAFLWRMSSVRYSVSLQHIQNRNGWICGIFSRFFKCVPK